MIYSEKVTLEREDSALCRQPEKVYVEVTARFTSDGRMEPLSLVWEDGRTFRIDRVLSRQRMASRKAGGVGILYLCRVGGSVIHLYYEENYRWFTERRAGES